MNLRLTGLAFATVLLVGCAGTSGSSDSEQQGRSDPLEGFNRVMFDFNYNYMDPYLVRPVAVAWRDYVPQPARNGTSNFLSNLDEPASMVNSLLKGDPYRAAIHFNRFFLNTLLGMGGLIDVAGMANPKLAREEAQGFGSTLGHYGVGYGPYVVLPGYGSATVRDEGGDLVDDLYPCPLSFNATHTPSIWSTDLVRVRRLLFNHDVWNYNSLKYSTTDSSVVCDVDDSSLLASSRFIFTIAIF